MNSSRVRKASLNDAGIIYDKIHKQEFGEINQKSFTKIFKDNLKNKNIHYFVYESDSSIKGFLTLHIRPSLHHGSNLAEICELFVDATMRGKGVGAKLFKEAKKTAKTNKCRFFEAACNIKEIGTPIFFKKVGFLQTHHKFSMGL